MTNYNSVNIGLTTDYTSYIDSIDFAIRVPVNPADLDAVAKAFAGTPAVPASGDTPAVPAKPATLEDIANAVSTAVQNAAPDDIQTLCTSLLKAFQGKSS